MREDLIKVLDKWAVSWQPCGSRYTCNPPPKGTDEDFICIASGNLIIALDILDFKVEGDPGSYDGMDDFISYRSGDINIIVAKTADFYRKFVSATEEAKSLNLLEKRDRIALFQLRLYGNDEVPL